MTRVKPGQPEQRGVASRRRWSLWDRGVHLPGNTTGDQMSLRTLLAIRPPEGRGPLGTAPTQRERAGVCRSRARHSQLCLASGLTSSVCAQGGFTQFLSRMIRRVLSSAIYRCSPWDSSPATEPVWGLRTRATEVPALAAHRLNQNDAEEAGMAPAQG